MNISLKDLVDAGVHFGHQRRRWNPKSRPFVYDHRNGTSIIDLEKTRSQLELAAKFVEDLVASGKDVLFIATKKQAQEIVREAAKSVAMPYAVNRWPGGGLTNFATIKNSLDKYRKYLQWESDGTLAKMLKKEAAVIRRHLARMNRTFEGLVEVRDLPGAVFIVDTKTESNAANEARRLGIPSIALVDTNSDPSKVDYPIPGNDDAAKSVRLIVGAIVEAIQTGLARRDAERAVKRTVTVQIDVSENEQPEVTIAPEALRAAGEDSENERGRRSGRGSRGGTGRARGGRTAVAASAAAASVAAEAPAAEAAESEEF